jgi:hypothetical protein
VVSTLPTGAGTEARVLLLFLQGLESVGHKMSTISYQVSYSSITAPAISAAFGAIVPIARTRYECQEYDIELDRLRTHCSLSDDT